MARLQFHGFDWDNGNIDKSLFKHGVAHSDIEHVLSQDGILARDYAHSLLEKRYTRIGLSPRGRYLFVVFTFRVMNHKIFIRPISARFMHAKEIKKYKKS
jgi:uncharacterized DUF497 family protein